VDDEADVDEENEEDLGGGGGRQYVRVLQCGELIDYRARVYSRTIAFAAGGAGKDDV